MKTPREKISGYDHSFAQVGSRHFHRRRENAAQKPTGLLALSIILLGFESLARDAHELRAECRNCSVASKNDGVPRLNVLWPMLLDHAENIPAEKNTPAGSNRIPPV